MTASTKCCNVKNVLAMWALSTDAQVCTKQNETFRSIPQHFVTAVGLLRIAAFRCELIRSVAETVIASHIHGMAKAIEKGLAAFIATLQGPFGQIPFERAVARHLPLFHSLRDRGLTWSCMASLLAARGVRRANGQPISVEQLRGVVSRQLRRPVRLVPDRIEPDGNVDENKVSRRSSSSIKHKRAKRPAVANQPGLARIQPDETAASAAERPKDIRAFMDRAARLRRSSVDDAD